MSGAGMGFSKPEGRVGDEKAPKTESTVTMRERKDEPGKTYDAGKVRFDLIPAEWELALAQIMTMGAAKYADRNWEKGLSWSRRYGSLRRHLNAFWAGEDLDPESGLPHLAHIAWNALALMTFSKTHPEFDDRPTTLARKVS